MLTHKEIMLLTVVVNPQNGGCYIVYSDTVLKEGFDKNYYELVFAPTNVHPQFVNLLAAAVLLYQTLQAEFEVMQKLIEHADELGFNAVAGSLTRQAATMQLSLRMAVEGVNSVLENPKNVDKKG